MAKKKSVRGKGNALSMRAQTRAVRIDNSMLDHARGLVEKEKHRKPGDADIRRLGYGTCLDRPSFINIDNAMNSAKLKTDYAKTLKLFALYFKDDNVIGKYIADKYICDFVRKELANKYSWNETERFLALIVKDITGIARPKEKPTYNFLSQKSYVVNWEDVTFAHGSYTINCPKNGAVSFRPLVVNDTMSIPMLNFIRDYLQEKMPRVYCNVQHGRLELTGRIDLSIAIRMLQSPRYSQIVEKRVNMLTSTRSVFRDGIAMSYEDSISKARKMSMEDFVVYKSKFINYLVKRQLEKYRIIPCNEQISHRGASITENAFIFTLRSSKWSNYVILVVENLNPDRATLLFKIEEACYESSLKTIHEFLKSPEINKRSNLRDSSELVVSLNAANFYAVNHRDDGPYPWRSTMEYRLGNM